MKKAIPAFKWIIPACLLLLGSCTKKEVVNTSTNLSTPSDLNDLLKTKIPASFNYVTTKDVAVNITILAPDNTPVSNILVNVLSKNIQNGGVVIFKSITDNDGNIKGNIRMPISYDQLVIDPQYIGVIRNATFNISSNDLTCTLGGTEGYFGDLQLNSTGRQTQGINTTIQKEMGYPAFSYMGTYNALGKPSYLQPNQLMKSAFYAQINAALPENQSVPDVHPEYLNGSTQNNINITQNSNISFTFLNEGSALKNSIAYFTYPTNKPPTSPDQIDFLHIILPNASMVGSGGLLQPGNTVSLGNFTSGTSIGFALLSSGWNGSIVNNPTYILYSLDQLNPQSSSAIKRQSVLLYDNVRSLFITGFNETRRDLSSTNDFNDCMFYITSTVPNAISQTSVAILPANLSAANNISYTDYYPCELTPGTMCFEDKWPYEADFDLNDVVLQYRYGLKFNSDNNIIGINANFILKASGAAFRNGFGIEFPFQSSLVKSVTGSLVTNNKTVVIGANGCEMGNVKAVIFPFDDALLAMGTIDMFNTYSHSPVLSRSPIDINITFTRPLRKSEVGQAPFNPFIIVNQERGREVHLVNHTPTEKVNKGYFKNGIDITDPSKGIYYKTTANLPWGLIFYDEFKYPAEAMAVNLAYSKFMTWAQSDGILNPNWYTDPTSQDLNLIYTP